MAATGFELKMTRCGELSFYAPVFKGVEHKLAKPVDDCASVFTRRICEASSEPAFFSCNCTLNYLHSNLGPITL